MPIRIGDGSYAWRSTAGSSRPPPAGGWWREVTYWPRFFDSNPAITRLTVTELLERGRDSNDPLVRVLRNERR